MRQQRLFSGATDCVRGAVSFLDADRCACGSRQLLWLLIWVLSISCMSQAAHAQELDITKELCAAFDERSKEWPEGYVESIVTDIVAIVRASDGGITQTKIEDLTRGLAGAQGSEEVKEFYHPTHKELCRQQTLHKVRSYLEHGPGKQSERELFQQQITDLVEGWQKYLVQEYPECKADIDEAAGDNLRVFIGASDNPLYRPYKRPVSKDTLSMIEKAWQQSVAEFKPPKPGQRSASMKFRGLMGGLLTAMKQYSAAPSASRSAELETIENEFIQKRPAISDWEHEKMAEIRDRKLREIDLKRLIKDEGGTPAQPGAQAEQVGGVDEAVEVIESNSRKDGKAAGEGSVKRGGASPSQSVSGTTGQPEGKSSFSMVYFVIVLVVFGAVVFLVAKRIRH